MNSTLTLNQFRSAFQAGGFRSVSLTGTAGQFFIMAEPQNGERVSLATTHGNKVRAFRNPAKAIELLHKMGAHKVEIDTSEWVPEHAAGQKRPDTAARQKRAHAAAAHDTWFRKEAEAAIEEADSPDAVWLTVDEVERISAVKRAEWRSRLPGTVG